MLALEARLTNQGRQISALRPDGTLIKACPLRHASGPISSNASTMSLAARETLVVSPHLDDAVFSCGAMLATSPGASVCTIFAGAPDTALVTGWDTQCGFADAHEAMRERRAEDTAALHILGARAVHLGFLDSQYAQGDAGTATREIASTIRTVMRETSCETIFIPLGLFHSDHALVHAAAREACLSDEITCIAYEDCLYRRMNGLVQQRLVELIGSGIEATPLLRPIDAGMLSRYVEAKQRAVQCYASQLKAFGPQGYDDVLAPERFWMLRALDRHA
ncbi:LmbE family protein [Caballeronia glebae]|uniref:LmbE family protein n=2 Tax=Caballeronia glebae TaxID=1777143 RepID=A0A158AQX2_9BURK|nr:LmbE family protein [Caballeronia glebae]